MLYTGFNLDNIQQLVNSLQWGLDNWVYGCAGTKASTITCPEKPDMPPVVLRGRGIRFHPDIPGSLEPTSGGGQYGLTADAFGHWFTPRTPAPAAGRPAGPLPAAQSVPDGAGRHDRHPRPRGGLQGVPHQPVRGLADRADAPRESAIPRFANWPSAGEGARRLRHLGVQPDRLLRRPLSAGSFAATRFMCDPANNVVHRDRLEANGPATFIARRADENCEFLASTDNWFRPVWLTLGPDGALYVCDFYREVIETPLSLPDDIKKKYNLESRGRGRIWRIVPDDGQKTPRPNLRRRIIGRTCQTPRRRQRLVADDGPAVTRRAAG